MTERIRFHLNENVDPVVALGLRRYEIDVTTTLEARLRACDDAERNAGAGRFFVNTISRYEPPLRATPSPPKTLANS